MRPFLLIFVICTTLLNLINIGFSAKNNAGTELKVIPNTNLLTGVYYQITVPKYPFGIVTWTRALRTNDGVGIFTIIDNHEDRKSRYDPGGDLYDDSLWVFEPSQEPEYFRIRNIAPHLIPSSMGAIIVRPIPIYSPEPGDAPVDDYIYELSGTRSSYIQSDNERYNYSLWKVVPSGAVDTFTLHNKGRPGYVIGVKYPGGVHTPYDENGNGYYTYWKIDSEPSHWPKYRRGGDKREDVLLKFQAMIVE